MAAHAFLLLDSYIYGFVVQEMSSPFDASDEIAELAGAVLQGLPADQYPHLAEMATEHVMRPGYRASTARWRLGGLGWGPEPQRDEASAEEPTNDYAHEFEFGLDLILHGLETYRDG